MKFRDDIDPARTWVTSDSHFGHNNIINFCHRPTDHEQLMMERWAQVVPPEDSTVLHLGDLSYRSNALFKNVIAKHLPGERKLLIQGNHDRQRYSFYKQSGFQIVRPFAIKYEKHIISFSHYPWGEDDSDDESTIPKNVIRVHGHIHNNGYFRDAFVPFLRNHINISIEQTKYRPVLLKNLLDGYLLGKVGVTAAELKGQAVKNG